MATHDIVFIESRHRCPQWIVNAVAICLRLRSMVLFGPTAWSGVCRGIVAGFDSSGGLSFGFFR